MKFLQAKNQSVEVKDLVEFIAQQTEEEVKQTQTITKLKAELEVLKQTTTTKEEEITKLKLEISTLEVTKTEQETKIAELNEQLEQKIAEQAQQNTNSELYSKKYRFLPWIACSLSFIVHAIQAIMKHYSVRMNNNLNLEMGPGETDSQQVSIDWESRYKRVEEQLDGKFQL